jgi:hypothetical protein
MTAAEFQANLTAGIIKFNHACSASANDLQGAASQFTNALKSFEGFENTFLPRKALSHKQSVHFIGNFKQYERNRIRPKWPKRYNKEAIQRLIDSIENKH